MSEDNIKISISNARGRRGLKGDEGPQGPIGDLTPASQAILDNAVASATASKNAAEAARVSTVQARKDAEAAKTAATAAQTAATTQNNQAKANATAAAAAKDATAALLAQAQVLIDNIPDTSNLSAASQKILDDAIANVSANVETVQTAATNSANAATAANTVKNQAVAANTAAQSAKTDAAAILAQVQSLYALMQELGTGTGGTGGTGGGTTPPPTTSGRTGSLKATVIPPDYTITSNSAYPPELKFRLNETITQDVDVLVLEASASRNFGTLLFSISRPLTVANISGADPVALFPELATIQFPAETYFRPYVQGPNYYSANGTVRKHGDITAPTISSLDNVSYIEGSPILYTPVASESGEWSLEGVDGPLLELTVDNKIRLKNNASPDYSKKTSYNFVLVFTDDAGLKKKQNMVFTITSLDRVPDQYTFLDLTNQEINTSNIPSNEITFQGFAVGITQQGSVAGTGIQYSTDSGANWLNAPGNFDASNGSKLKLRATTLGYNTARNATVTVNGITDKWTVTTKSNPVGVSAVAGVQPDYVNIGYASNQMTDTITVEAGDLYWWTSGNGSDRSVMSVTCNDAPMELVWKTPSGDNYEVWRIRGVTAGQKTIITTFNLSLTGWQPNWVIVKGAVAAMPAVYEAQIGYHGGNQTKYMGQPITVGTNGLAVVLGAAPRPWTFTNIISRIAGPPTDGYDVGIMPLSGEPGIVLGPNGGYVGFRTLNFTAA